MSKRIKQGPEEAIQMCDLVEEALDDAKGIEIKTMDVRELTDVTDYMVIATGTSDRHVKTLADRVLEFMTEKDWKPLGIEGEDARDWVLVDYVDVVVHIMREQTRKHYDLEGLWNETFGDVSVETVVEILEGETG